MYRTFFTLFLVFLAALAGYSQPAPAGNAAPFVMGVEDVFPITGRGTVIIGKVERGVVRTGDALEILTASGPIATTAVEVTMFRKSIPEGKEGDNVGILLRAVDKSAVARGDVVAKPGTLKTFTKLTAKFDLKATSDGGRTRPITSGFRPLVDIRTASLSGVVTLPAGRTEAAAGEKSVELVLELSRPAPLEKGQAIVLREYGKIIATGIVTAFTTVK